MCSNIGWTGLCPKRIRLSGLLQHKCTLNPKSDILLERSPSRVCKYICELMIPMFHTNTIFQWRSGIGMQKVLKKTSSYYINTKGGLLIGKYWIITYFRPSFILTFSKEVIAHGYFKFCLNFIRTTTDFRKIRFGTWKGQCLWFLCGLLMSAYKPLHNNIR